MQSDVPVFMYHITFRVPVLVDSVAEDLDELLQDGSLTPIALLREFGRVVVVAVHIAFVLVV